MLLTLLGPDDISFSTRLFTFRGSRPTSVSITFEEDSIAQESEESMQLRLINRLPQLANSIFLDTLTVVVRDSNSEFSAWIFVIMVYIHSYSLVHGDFL